MNIQPNKVYLTREGHEVYVTTITGSKRCTGQLEDLTPWSEPQPVEGLLAWHPSPNAAWCATGEFIRPGYVHPLDIVDEKP